MIINADLNFVRENVREKVFGPSPFTEKQQFQKIKDSHYFGLSRPYAYKLINNNQVKSISLRERGKAKGVRLISYDSLANYCDKLALAQN